MQLSFSKMQGAGNDFVVIDATREPIELTAAQVKHLGDRRFGVGADQILVVEASDAPGVDFRYRIFNNSGDEVEHCGNGARCLVRFVHDKGLSPKTTLRVETVNNLLELRLCTDGRVTVDMNRPLFALAQLPFDADGLRSRAVGDFEMWPLALSDGSRVEVAVLSMGNPHAVQIVADVDAAPVAGVGPLVEKHSRFPRKVNAGFMQIVEAPQSGCASTSATPARRSPAAPAPARPSSPASASACSTARSRWTRAAASWASNGPGATAAC